MGGLCPQADGCVDSKLTVWGPRDKAREATTAVLIEASWPSFRIYFLHNVLAQVPKGNADMVAAADGHWFSQAPFAPLTPTWMRLGSTCLDVLELATREPTIKGVPTEVLRACSLCPLGGNAFRPPPSRGAILSAAVAKSLIVPRHAQNRR